MLTTSIPRIILTRSFKPFRFQPPTSTLSCSDQMQVNPGLYVHIPFCRSLCSFCPYCKERYDADQASRYLQGLLAEIDLVGSACSPVSTAGSRRQTTSLYFGGGTPALMIDELSTIIEHLERYFEIKDGIGVELHPDDIRPEVIAKLKSAGFSMVSIGIQSFDPFCLSQLGRNDTSSEHTLQLIAAAGFDVIDIDLIFGIPGQTADSLRRDVLTAFACGATQVSTYPFIDFTFAQNKHKPVSQRRKRNLLNLLSQLCSDLDLERTAIWTFARKGTEKYSSVTRSAFLGFGASATTLLGRQFRINTFSTDAYIDRCTSGQLPASLTLSFSKRQQAAYYLFWAAYSLRIGKSEFQKNTGNQLDSTFGSEIKTALLLGLLKNEKDGVGYILTSRGAGLYHWLEQQYTHAYIDRIWRISRETAFPGPIFLK